VNEVDHFQTTFLTALRELLDHYTPEIEGEGYESVEKPLMTATTFTMYPSVIKEEMNES
jgi:hypothetical protein